MLAGESVDDITRPVLRPGAPAIAVPVGATRPAMIVGMTVAGAKIIARPGIMPAALPVLIATMVRPLVLVYGIGPGLDRQVIAGLGRTSRTVGFLVRTALPLTALRLVVLGASLIAGVGLIMFRAWLIAEVGLVMFRAWLIARITLWPALVVFLARLVIAALSLLPVRLPVTGAGVLRIFLASLFFGQHLPTDTHAKQANCSQTPDVRFHAVSHGRIGRKHKTGKPGTGSARDYQLPNLFSDNKKGRPVGRPLNFSVLAQHS